MHKHLDRMRRMHALIKFCRTGTPEAFALRIGVSVSMLYRLIAQLKELGAPVHYCHQRRSYAYYESVELQIGFVRIANPTSVPARAKAGKTRVLHPDRLAAS